MTKYAITIASLLALTACEHSQNGGYSRTGSETSSPGTSGGTSSPSTYGQNAPINATPSTSGSVDTGRSSTAPEGTSSASGTVSQTPSATTGVADSTQRSSDTVNGSTAVENKTPVGTTGTTSASSANPNSSGTSSAASTVGQSPAPTDSGTGLGDQSRTAAGAQSGLGPTVSAADRSLSQSITNALMTAGVSSQSLTNIHVRAINGAVILTGQVNSQTEKQSVETHVKQTAGVRTVINQLRVAGAKVSTPLDTSVGGGAGNSSSGQGTGTGISDRTGNIPRSTPETGTSGLGSGTGPR